MTHFITVAEDDDGQRLDRWLKKQGIPYALIQKLIRKGAVRVDDKRIKADVKLQAGQNVRIPNVSDMPAHVQEKVSEKDASFMRSLIIYDDGDIIAINKPQGIATQGGSKVLKHIDGMLDALQNKKGIKPKLIHRLDKDTSGVLLLARSADMVRALGQIFKGRNIRKIYWAITISAPDMNDGEITAPIGPMVGGDKEKMGVDPDNGQVAKTSFEVIERAGKKLAFVAFSPKTGRKHQIRVHSTYMGCPILGDNKYTDETRDVDVALSSKKLHLHAYRLTFKHPKTSKVVDIQASLPADLEASWKALGFSVHLGQNIFEDIVVE